MCSTTLNHPHHSISLATPINPHHSTCSPTSHKVKLQLPDICVLRLLQIELNIFLTDDHVKRMLMLSEILDKRTNYMNFALGVMNI